ncbi:MAG: hypothetical protein QF357_03480 [Dehalococcoidia bacterium]|nr:hypothetical protein [Dehalococcoidia bacterium]
MKPIFRFSLVTFFVVLAVVFSACSTEQLPPHDEAVAINTDTAREHYGEYVRACDFIASAVTGPEEDGKPVYLSFMVAPGPADSAPGALKVFITGKHRSKFPDEPEAFYAGRMVCAYGIVEDKNGPIIEVMSPEHLEIVISSS